MEFVIKTDKHVLDGCGSTLLLVFSVIDSLAFLAWMNGADARFNRRALALLTLQQVHFSTQVGECYRRTAVCTIDSMNVQVWSDTRLYQLTPYTRVCEVVRLIVHPTLDSGLARWCACRKQRPHGSALSGDAYARDHRWMVSSPRFSLY